MDSLKPYTYIGTIVKVIDGDTFVVDLDLGFGLIHKDVTCRVLVINAPEIHGSEKELGVKVKSEVESLLPVGKKVTIHSSSLDSFGRCLVVVEGDFGNLAEILIAKALVKKWDGKGSRPTFTTN